VNRRSGDQEFKNFYQEVLRSSGVRPPSIVRIRSGVLVAVPFGMIQAFQASPECDPIEVHQQPRVSASTLILHVAQCATAYEPPSRRTEISINKRLEAKRLFFRIVKEQQLLIS